MKILKENEMKKLFNEIVKLCEEKEPEYGDEGSYFKKGASEREIVKWEKATKVSIPETYREWLKLTKSCQICQTTASFFFPKVEQPKFIPEDYVVIGYVVGDGEVMCFSKSKGNFVTYFEGKVNEEYEDFFEVLEETKRMIKDERDIFIFTDEMLAELAEFDEMEEEEN